MKKLLAAFFSLIFVLCLTSVVFAEEKEMDRQDKIKQAQEELKELGFYKGDATGKMNPETREAVKEFQKKEMDMKMPGGILNEKTCTAISEKAKAKKETKKDEKGGVEKAVEKVKEGMDIKK